MSKIRNPHLIPTGTIVGNASAVNVEKAITVEKGINVDELNFNFGQSTIEKPVVWKFDAEATRDTEFGLATISSTTWAAGTTRKPFVISSAATINNSFGVNLDIVDQIGKDTIKKEIGGADVYRIVFTYEGIGTIKYLFWEYASESDRNDVYDEITNNIAGMTFL